MKNIFGNKISKRNLILAAIILSVIVILITSQKREENEPGHYTEVEISEENLNKPEGENSQPDPSITEPGFYDPEVMRDFFNRYPWYQQLPVETDEYIVVWDIDSERFRIRLKIPESSPQDIKDSLVSKARESIKNLVGTNFEEYDYYVVYSR